MKLNKEKRLTIYKQMLKDYSKRCKDDNKTFAGFCYYINKTQYRLEYELKDLIELYLQKPKNYTHYPYWFKKGCLAPRIRCLKAAIKLCENEN